MFMAMSMPESHNVSELAALIAEQRREHDEDLHSELMFNLAVIIVCSIALGFLFGVVWTLSQV